MDKNLENSQRFLEEQGLEESFEEVLKENRDNGAEPPENVAGFLNENEDGENVMFKRKISKLLGKTKENK